MAKQRLAIVTMAFNEEDFLPVWLRHHARQAGRENCFIVDHGSTDASTAQLAGANVLRLARSPLDEMQRCRFISQFCSSLLNWYDYVAYADADELLLADPARHADLSEYCRAAPRDVTTAFGMNVVHRLGQESELVATNLVSRQRAWAMPVASMCKPCLTRRPIDWAPGFHSADAAVAFDDLFLMHLAYVDIDLARRRQRKRQMQARVTAEENPHHQVDPTELIGWLGDWSVLAEVTGAELDADCPVRRGFADQIVASQDGRQSDRYRIDISLKDERLWRLPGRFAGSF